MLPEDYAYIDQSGTGQNSRPTWGRSNPISHRHRSYNRSMASTRLICYSSFGEELHRIRKHDVYQVLVELQSIFFNNSTAAPSTVPLGLIHKQISQLIYHAAASRPTTSVSSQVDYDIEFPDAVGPRISGGMEICRDMFGALVQVVLKTPPKPNGDTKHNPNTHPIRRWFRQA